MNFIMNLQDKFFNMVKSGNKTLEVRLLDDKRKKLMVGDTIEFSNSTNEKISVIIISIQIYDNFIDLLKDNNYLDIGLNNSTEEEALNELYSIYPKEKSSKYKAIAIKFIKK
ncbi:MAG: ASCH domain-containing protein [Clostridiales bacterium]|nr:ASCH domain-containing protein [Clostridiales bacterium]